MHSNEYGKLVANLLEKSASRLVLETQEHDDHSMWVVARDPQIEVPSQGWKLHISANLSSAEEILRISVPILAASRCWFKLAAEPQVLLRLNQGGGGASQVGKFLTIYPADDETAVTLAHLIHAKTEHLKGPRIPSDKPLFSDSIVSYRYGAFAGQLMQMSTGEVVPHLADADRQPVPDVRSVQYIEPAWCVNPFTPSTGQAEEAATLLIANRYLLTGLVRRTATTSIWMGLDLADGHRCIVKRAFRCTGQGADGRDACARLKDEASYLRLFEAQPMYPKAEDILTVDGDTIMISQDLGGVSVAEHLSYSLNYALSPLDEPSVCAILQGAAEALKPLHQAGLVFGDLSPGNLIINDGFVFLIDFESVRKVGEINDGRGTPGYFEANSIHSKASFHDDFYSLGCLAFHLLTGEEISSPLAKYANIIPSHLAQIIDTCVSRPGYSSVDQFISDLRPRRSGIKLERNDAQQADPLRFRKLARSLMDKIVAEQMQRGDLGCVWRSSPDVVKGGLSKDVNAGSAGIIIALTELATAFESDSAVQTLQSAVKSMMKMKRFPGPPLPGLFVGEAGAVYAAYHAALMVKDDAMLSWSLERACKLRQTTYRNPDIFGGAAGCLKFHLRLYQASEDRDHLVAACEAADFLLSVKQERDAEAWWPIPEDFGDLSGNCYLGYAHGAAGIGDALLELFRCTGAPELKIAATQACRWLINNTRFNSTGAASWPETLGSLSSAPYWCHGAGGIARFLGRACMLGLDVDGREPTVIAAAQSIRRAYWLGPSLCHGLAGSVESLLDLAISLKQDCYVSDAEHLLDQLMIRLDQNADIEYQCAKVGPEYLVGYAGIALAALHFSTACNRELLPADVHRLSPFF